MYMCCNHNSWEKTSNVKTQKHGASFGPFKCIIFYRLARRALQQQGYPSIFDQKLRPHHTMEMGPKHEAPVAALRSACCLVL